MARVSASGRPITLVTLPSMRVDERPGSALDAVRTGLVDGSPVDEVPVDHLAR